MDSFPVKVYIYDLSKGLARSMSLPFLGKQIDGIWHTAIVVFDSEFFFGGGGIENCAPGGTIMGRPDSVVELGSTEIPHEMLMEYLQDLANTSYRPESYHLLEHNCNNFSNDLAEFLTGRSVPAYITSLPQDVLNTPFGAMIKPFLDSMSVPPIGGQQIAPNIAAGAMSGPSTASMPGTTVSPAASAATSENLAKFQPVIYDEKSEILRAFSALIESSLAGSSQAERLTDIAVYLNSADPLWGLSPQHLKCIEDASRITTLAESERCTLLGLLQLIANVPDGMCMMKADREHTVMRLLNHASEQPPATTETLLKVACNCSSTEPGYSWCTDSVQWSAGGLSTSNVKVSTNLCVSSLLSDNSVLNQHGAALACNLTRIHMNEDLLVEVGSALIELLAKGLENERGAKMCLQAFNQCLLAPEVSSLAQVMGLDLSKYSAFSDDSIKQILSQVNRKLILL